MSAAHLVLASCHVPDVPDGAAPASFHWLHRLGKSVAALFSAPGGTTRLTPWCLQPGQALSFRVRRASVLQLQSGAAWVTQRGVMPRAVWPATDSASTDSGDIFLQAGQCLAVYAGQHLVLESARESASSNAGHPAQGLVAGVLARPARRH